MSTIGEKMGLPYNITVELVIDLTVALEGLLYPDMADARCDPKAVNQRALDWINTHCEET